MKAVVQFSFFLFAALLGVLPARAWVPDPGEKVTGRVGPFDRTWHKVETEEGDAILELLLDPNSFEEPLPKPDDGPVARIAPPTLSLTSDAPERDMALYIDFWRHTDCDTDEPRLEVLLPDSGQRWRVLDEPARKLLAMFEAWEAADREAFLAEAFPRRYVLGSNRHDGGTLSGVALLCYGNGTQWRTIWEANREAVPDPDRPGTSILSLDWRFAAPPVPSGLRFAVRLRDIDRPAVVGARQLPKIRNHPLQRRVPLVKPV